MSKEPSHDLGHPTPERPNIKPNPCVIGYLNKPRGKGYTLSGDPLPEEGSEEYEKSRRFVEKYKRPDGYTYPKQ
jgi:hypothetical protein